MFLSLLIQIFWRPDLRTYMKIVNKPKQSLFHTIFRKHSASFICEKCHAKTVQSQVADCQETKGKSIFKVPLENNEFN